MDAPRTVGETIALLELGLAGPLSGPCRAVESPDTPGHWRVLGPMRGQIVALLPGFGVDPDRVAASARAMARVNEMLALLRACAAALGAVAEGRDMATVATHLTRDVEKELRRIKGLGCTVNPVAGTILCHACGLMGHHPRDVAEHFCGKCHVFHPGGEAPAR